MKNTQRDGTILSDSLHPVRLCTCAIRFSQPKGHLIEEKDLQIPSWCKLNEASTFLPNISEIYSRKFSRLKSEEGRKSLTGLKGRKYVKILHTAAKAAPITLLNLSTPSNSSFRHHHLLPCIVFFFLTSHIRIFPFVFMMPLPTFALFFSPNCLPIPNPLSTIFVLKTATARDRVLTHWHAAYARAVRAAY